MGVQGGSRKACSRPKVGAAAWMAAFAAAVVVLALWAGSGAEAQQTGQVEFVAVGLTGRIIHSEDGSSWTAVSPPPTSSSLYGVAFGNGVWVAVGANGAVVHSSDGISWAPVVPAPTAANLRGVTYGGGMFMAVGTNGAVLTSTDGQNWSPGNSGTTANLCGVAHDGGNRWVAGGGTTACSYFNAVSTLLTSTNNGASWTPATTPISNYQILDVAHDQQGRWMATTGGDIATGAIYTSTDGTAWSMVSGYPHTWEIEGIAYSDAQNRWVAAGYNGVATTTTGGTSWSPATIPPSFTWWRAVAHHPGLDLWAVVGGNTVLTSSTGTSFTAVPTLPSPTNGLYAITVRTGPTADPATSTVTATPTEIVADGASTGTITVLLRNADGDPLGVGGPVVTVETDDGVLSALGASGASIVAEDHGDGTYTATLTSPTTVGQANVTAYIGSALIQDTALVDFVPGPPSGATSTLDAQPATLTADGESTATVTLRLFDAHGNALTAGGHSVTLSTDLGTLPAASIVDHGDGTYTGTLTSATTVGNATVGAVVQGTPVDATAVVEFLPGPPSAPHSILSVTPDELVADGLGTADVTLVLRDRFGNLVGQSGGPVDFSVPAVLGTVSAATDHGNGTYTALYTAGTKTGHAVITATLLGQKAPDAVVRLLPGPLDPTATTLEAVPSELVADGAATATVTLGLRDQYGNLVEEGGHDVRIRTDLLGELSAGGAAGTEVVPEDQGDGTYTAVLTAPTVLGQALLTATLDAAPILDASALPVSATVQFVPGPPSATHSILEAQPATIHANGLDEATATLTLFDAFDNPVGKGGFTVTMQTDLGWLSDVEDHGDGTYTTRLAGLDPGKATVTAHAAGGLLDAAVDLAAPPGPFAVLLDPADRVCRNVPTSLQAVAHHGGVEALEWHWTFAHGQTLVVPAQDVLNHRAPLEYAFPERGLQAVEVTAHFANGATATAHGDVMVLACIPPVAEFSHQTEDQTRVRFEDRSHDPDPLAGIVAWHWDFGDGSTSTEQNPVHTYDGLDHYMVALTVTDAEGTPTTATRIVTLSQFSSPAAQDRREPSGPGSGAPGTVPVALVSGPGEARGGHTVSLDGSGSSPSWVRYTWSQVSGPDVAWLERSGPSASFVAPEVQGEEVLRFSLVVRDGALSSQVAYHSVRVAPGVVNQPPVASGTAAPAVAESGDRVRLDGSRSSDPDGNPLSYAWVQVSGPGVDLVGGDGVAASFTAPEVEEPAELTFRLTVSDGRLEDSEELTVRVEPPASPEAGFTAQAVGDARVVFEPSLPASMHAWEFGDGSPVSHVAAPVHAYPGPGEYEVVHRVWDDQGRVAEERMLVAVPEGPGGVDVGPAVGPGEEVAGVDAEAHAVPGLGGLLMLAVLGGAAVLLRRR